MGTRVSCRCRADFCAQTTTSGLAVQAVARQSIDSNSIDNCAIVSDTTPSLACGQMNRPRSSFFAVQAHSLTIPKQDLDQVTSATPEDVERTAVGIMVQHCLHLGRQRVEALPHIGHTAGQIDPNLTGRQHHRPSRMVSTPRSTFRSAPWPTRTRTPLRISISIFPSWHGVEFDGAAGATSGSAIRCTGWNLALASTISWRRHVNNRPVLISCRSATRFATAPGAKASSTIRSLSTGVHRRRRSRRTRNSICSGRSLSRGRLRASYDASSIFAAGHPPCATQSRRRTCAGKGAVQLTHTIVVEESAQLCRVHYGIMPSPHEQIDVLVLQRQASRDRKQLVLLRRLGKTGERDMDQSGLHVVAPYVVDHRRLAASDLTK